MAKIVIDARIISSSTGRYIERLLTYLEKIDEKNEYVVLVPEKDIDYWKPKSKNFTLQVSKYKNFSFNEQLGFAWQLYRLKADLVHFCMPQQPVLYFKPSITTMHDLILLQVYNSDKNWLVFHLKQLVGRFVFFYLAHKSRYIITPSNFSKKQYLSRYKIKANKVVTTYLAADTDTYTAEKIQLPYKKFIMYVGQQSDYKNVRRLIHSHQKLLQTFPDLGLVFVGSMNTMAKRNKEWVDKKGYKNILFAGFVEDHNLAWMYQHTEAYVFPSLMEGFGLPGLEAMVQGAPVVSSDATCLPEIYGDAAHYFNPKDVDDIANKIADVLNDESLRTTLIKNGYTQIKKYSWAKTAKQTLGVYRDALRENEGS